MRRFCFFAIVCFLLSGVFAQDLNLFDADDEDCLKDIDLMIVLDGSFSVTETNFDIVKNWVKKVAQDMKINEGHIQIGVVQYSHYYPNRPLQNQPYIRTEIGLGEHKNLAAFNAAVDRIQYQGFKTFTAHALDKTLSDDFVGSNNRYPEAKRALILLTDGRATDSKDLPPVIEKAEKEMGVVMYAVGVGQFDEDELHLITHNHTSRVFKLENFEDLDKIVTNLQIQLQESCDCNAEGSLDESCNPCTRECVCKANVFGRRCDKCVDNYFGFGNVTGCSACNCNSLGSLREICAEDTGECMCRPNIQGKTCESCDAGFFGFPDCKACDCNGFSDICDETTGMCIACLEGRRGDHCEICPSGQFLDNESNTCVLCVCNGNVDLNDPDACNPTSGICQKCLYNTAGNKCEKCAEFHYGNALVQSCSRCQCDKTGTDLSTCEGEDCTCNTFGACTCLPNVEGNSCDRCAPGTWEMSSRRGCIECECSSTGSQPNTTCDKVSGACVCKEQYSGLKCKDCSEGFQEDLEEGCVDVKFPKKNSFPPTRNEKNPKFQSDLYGDEPNVPDSTTTTTTPTTMTTPKPKAIRVNPGWSPCVSCGVQKWPSYCRGWMCRKRWPYSRQTPSSRRCYSWNWSCRSSVEKNGYQQSYQPRYQQSNYNTGYNRYNRQPAYYRGYYHHARFLRPQRRYRASMRFNLYRN